MNFNLINIVLIFSLLIVMALIAYLYKNRQKGLLYKEFMFSFIFLFIHILPLIFQIAYRNSNIPPIYFDYISYVGAMGNTTSFLLIALTYRNPKINIKKCWILAVIPIFSILVLWTNDFHHLFYQVYSIYMEDIVIGIYGQIYVLYSYMIVFLAFYIFLATSIKNAGFFSIQTGLIFLGIITPVSGNLLGTFKLINVTIYITPILFIFTGIFCGISIIKYKALNITPIATRTLINIMSDSFLVISNDGTIVDINDTFKKTFKNVFDSNKVENLFKFMNTSKLFDINKLNEVMNETRKNGNKITIELNTKINGKKAFFDVDIQPIKSKNNKEYIGTLLLFKDITQHKQDIETIKQKQDVIVRQGQLSSIGELAGGVAHDINTPIAAIKSGILMFREMLGKRSSEEMELLQRMDNCADKIIRIVNSMRNQIRNLGSDQDIYFKISDIITDIKVISYNELMKHNCILDVKIIDDISLKGDPTKLSQVITNLVINAIQAYSGNGGTIEIKVVKIPKNLVLISVHDNAGGIDEKIKPYIFKNILTTKGTKGTGLGLYLAYSVIKSSFDGDITFESETGKGTTFYITIPINNLKDKKAKIEEQKIESK